MINNRKRKGLIVFGVLVFGWLIISTKFITGIYNRQIEITSNIAVPEVTTEMLYYSIDDIYESEDIFNSLNIIGWALCPSSEPNERQKTYILLESSANIYKLSTTAEYRMNLPAMFKDLGFDKVGAKHGFSLNFCPYFIPDGEYTVSLVCQEDTIVLGKQNTQYLLKKSAGKSQFVLADSQRLTELESKEYEEVDIRGWIDSCKREGDELIIKGWMFSNTEMVRGEEHIIGLSLNEATQYYLPTSYVRGDLISITTADNCRTAGFALKIPMENLENAKTVKVSFCIQTKDGLYKSIGSQTIELQ